MSQNPCHVVTCATGVHPSVNPGGRPPDPVSSILISQSLERATSPPLLGDLSDTEVVVPTHQDTSESVPKGSGGIVQPDQYPREGVAQTYASMVAKGNEGFGTGGASNAQHPSMLGNGRGSRFAVLENVENMGPDDNSKGAVEELPQVAGIQEATNLGRQVVMGASLSMNEAYKKSYPNKKSKMQGKKEQGDEMRLQRVDRGKSVKIGVSKGGILSTTSAVRFRKPGNARHSVRMGVSEFVDRLEGALDKLPRGNGEHENFVPMVSDDDSLWTDSQLEEEGDFDAHFHDVGIGDQ
ncbi:hypothetical protein V6N13_108216 [Hibiscus sabdariffa]|uniref:Uncharacterized protein n=1 Tax=Hibiscus sabdariffa TaxID=183260 RepID=A0ABR2SRV7_9ROSI